MSQATLEYQQYRADEDVRGMDSRSAYVSRQRRITERLNAYFSGRRFECLVDFGSYKGAMLAQLEFARRRIAVDTNASFVEYIRRRVPDMEAFVATLPEVPRELVGTQIDCITCFQCLYYLDQDELIAAVNSMYQLARPGGYLLTDSVIPEGNPFVLVDRVQIEVNRLSTDWLYKVFEKADVLERCLTDSGERMRVLAKKRRAHRWILVLSGASPWLSKTAVRLLKRWSRGIYGSMMVHRCLGYLGTRNDMIYVHRKVNSEHLGKQRGLEESRRP